MSFLYYNTNTPDVDANFRNIKSDNVYQKNLETGEYERVGSGGGGPGNVPYWVQPLQANIFDNASRDEAVHSKLGYTVRNVADAQEVKVTKNGVEIDSFNSATGSELTSTSLTFGDEGGNSSINKISCKNLAEVGARIDKVAPVAADKMLIYDTSGGMYKTTPWLPYLKPASIVTDGATTGSSFDSSGINTYTLNINNVSNISPTGLHVGMKTSASNPVIDTNRAYTRIRSSNIELINRQNGYNGTIIYASAIVALISDGIENRLTFDNLGDLNHLYEKTAITTPTSEEKMLLYNPTTLAYQYTDIPSIVGVPAYVKPAKIEWVDGTKTVKTDSVGLSIVDDSTTIKTGVTIEKQTSGICINFSRNKTPASPINEEVVPLYFDDVQGINQITSDTYYEDSIRQRPAAGDEETWPLEFVRTHTSRFFRARIDDALRFPSFYTTTIDQSIKRDDGSGYPVGTFTYTAGMSTLDYPNTVAYPFKAIKRFKIGDVFRIRIPGTRLQGCRTGEIFNIPMNFEYVVNNVCAIDVSVSDVRFRAEVVPAIIKYSPIYPQDNVTENGLVLRFLVPATTGFVNLSNIDVFFTLKFNNVSSPYIPIVHVN